MSEANTPPPGDPDHSFAPALSVRNTDYRHARFPERIAWRREHASRERPSSSPSHAPHRPVIVVVGVCSSGKSSLVRALREKGYNACSVSQEHSYVPHLWQRSRPDLLVYLDATLRTIRARGRRTWSQPLLDEERARLRHARHHCHLYIPTDGLALYDVVARVLTHLAKTSPNPQPSPAADQTT